MAATAGARTPEQPFASVDVSDAAVTAEVGTGNKRGEGFGLAVTLRVELPDWVDAETGRKLVEQAHQVCPYSNGTRATPLPLQRVGTTTLRVHQLLRPQPAGRDAVRGVRERITRGGDPLADLQRRGDRRTASWHERNCESSSGYR
jgi:hypothetical protein